MKLQPELRELGSKRQHSIRSCSSSPLERNTPIKSPINHLYKTASAVAFFKGKASSHLEKVSLIVIIISLTGVRVPQSPGIIFEMELVPTGSSTETDQPQLFIKLSHLRTGKKRK